MTTIKEAENNKEIIYKRYGHLLDKYIDAGGYPDTALSREQEEYIKDVENGRYGHFLDNVTDPVQKIYDRMMKLYYTAQENTERRAEEKERHEQKVRKHIRDKIEKEKLHNDRMCSFADGLIERKKAKIEAEAAQRAEEERRKREEQKHIERFRHYTDSVNKAREMTTRAKELMERGQKREEEHNRRMAWFDSQKRE